MTSLSSGDICDRVDDLVFHLLCYAKNLVFLSDIDTADQLVKAAFLVKETVEASLKVEVASEHSYFNNKIAGTLIAVEYILAKFKDQPPHQQFLADKIKTIVNSIQVEIEQPQQQPVEESQNEL